VQAQSLQAHQGTLNIVALGAAIAPGAEWQRRAVERYRRQQPDAAAALRAEIAARVGRLTGRAVDLSMVVVNEQQQAALVTIDAVQFRWDRTHLTVIRPCAHCGLGSFASPPIHDTGDLGYALSDWKPLHPDCQLFEPDDIH
jgi:hypothetical protein